MSTSPINDQVLATLALQQLVADYFDELDATAGLNALPFFTADCIFDLGSMVLQGHEQIERFYRDFARKAAEAGPGSVRTTRHAFTNLRMSIDGDEATLGLLVLNFSGIGKPPLHAGTTPSVVSDARLRCRREADGRWRICHFGGRPVFVGNDPLQNQALLGGEGGADDGLSPQPSRTAAEANTHLVRRFYTLMSEQKFDEMFALMADDATWTVAGNPETFHHAGVADRQARIAAFSNFTRVFASLDMEIRSTTAQDERVAVEAITRCATHGGLRYVNELLVLVRCRNGRIISIYEHLDQQTALAFDEALRTELQPS